MGGKRKKSNNGPLKKESKYKIPSRFDCPLCDTRSSVSVKITRKWGTATVHCHACQVGKERTWPILPLEHAVDVFFRFREELMKLDREATNGWYGRDGEVGTVPPVRTLAELDRRIVAPPPRLAVVEPKPRRQTAAGEEDAEEGAEHHFAAPAMDDDDEYDAMFA